MGWSQKCGKTSLIFSSVFSYSSMHPSPVFGLPSVILNSRRGREGRYFLDPEPTQEQISTTKTGRLRSLRALALGSSVRVASAPWVCPNSGKTAGAAMGYGRTAEPAKPPSAGCGKPGTRKNGARSATGTGCRSWNTYAGIAAWTAANEIRWSWNSTIRVKKNRTSPG